MSDTQSVLDMMTAGIMDRKADKATGLTPVGLETPKPAIAVAQGDAFPYDAGVQNQIDHSARVIRNELVQIEACLKSIERTVGTPEGGYPPTVAVGKADIALTSTQAAEAAGDAAAKAFQKDWEAKAKAAQAQTFTGLDDEGDTPRDKPVPHDVERTDLWNCPEHGASATTTLKSRKGRIYSACVECSQFEKEG